MFLFVLVIRFLIFEHFCTINYRHHGPLFFNVPVHISSIQGNLPGNHSITTKTKILILTNIKILRCHSNFSLSHILKLYSTTYIFLKEKKNKKKMPPLLRSAPKSKSLVKSAQLGF